MTERDWEASARARLERNIADTVSRIRDTADQIEREARRNVASAVAAERDLEFQTYPRAAGQVVHTVQTMVFNLKLDSTIEAAADAEAAWTEKRAAEKVTGDSDSQAGRILALAAMAEAAKGWAEDSAQDDIDLDRWDRKPAEEQDFRLSDILNMINDTARELGLPEFPTPIEIKTEENPS